MSVVAVVSNYRLRHYQPAKNLCEAQGLNTSGTLITATLY